MNRSPLGTLRGALSALAVTSLTTTCLALTIAPASADDLPASNLPDHRFRADSSGQAASFYLYDYANEYTWAASADDAHAGSQAYFQDYDPQDGHGTYWYGGSSGYANGPRVYFAGGEESLSYDATAYAGATPGQPNPKATAPGGTSTPRGLGSVGENTAEGTSTTHELGQAAVGPVDEVISTARATSRGLDLGRIAVGSSTFDPVTSVHESAAEPSSQTRWVAIEGSERRGVESSSDSGIGSYRLLNDTVLVEILTPAKASVSVDGVGMPRTSVDSATVRVTGPDGVPHLVESGSSYRHFTFADPEDPTVEVSFTVSYSYSDATQVTQASATSYAVSGGYQRVRPDSGRDYLGGFQLGTAYASAVVPSGGIDVSEVTDIDGDGLDDLYESRYRYDMTDPDMDDDGLLDGQEVELGSDPRNSDSDGDGLLDGDEVTTHGTSPTSSDTDGDGLDDRAEVEDHGTKPTEWDTDEDGLSDGQEVGTPWQQATGTDPLDDDTDGDTLSDGTEVNSVGSNPLEADTDGGTADDGDEVALGTNPLDPEDDYTIQDRDQDGLTGAQERAAGTDPDNADSDGDTLLDGAEVNTHDTDPTLADTDDDGLRDDDEVALGTQARVADSDEDGLQDGPEVHDHGTDPLKADTDEDTLSDGDEVERGTDPLAKDTDLDGLDDADEVERGTNPLVADSDEDGLGDGDEVERGTNPLVADSDEDGLDDGDEVRRGTDPLATDTDGDGLQDGPEVTVHRTDPTKADTDGDALGDGDEVTGALNRRWGAEPTNPLRADSDRDGLTDAAEVKGVRVAGRLVRPNPNDAHSDSDRIKDGVEVRGYKTRSGKVFRSNPVSADSDRDGIRDLVEVLGLRNWRFGKKPTDPLRADTDRDGFRDLREVLRRTNPADKSSFPGSRRR